MLDAIAPAPSTIPAMNVLPPISARFAPSMNIDAVAQDFEAMFATQLLQPMFKTVPVNATFGGGHGEEIMRSFLLQEYGKLIAKTGMLGIASQVKSEMLRAQEASNNKSAASANTPSGAKPTTSAPVSSSRGGSNVAHG